MRAVTAAQMRAIDAAAVAREGEVALMRAAGDAIARLIDRYARGDGAVVAVAGSGNNGGDAYAALASHDETRRRVIFADASASVRHDGAARPDARERARGSRREDETSPPVSRRARSVRAVREGAVRLRQ